MTDNIEQLNEVMSFASFMDVQELRDLYYGRLNIYVSFTDDGEFDRDGKDALGDVVRPKSVVAYTVDAVVGRKASTPFLYGRIFRLKKDANFMKNIQGYTKAELENDLELLEIVGFYDLEEIEEIKNDVLSDTTIRGNFEKFWEVTKRLAETKGRQLAPGYWRKTLLELDYTGFEDPNGNGPFAEQKAATALILDEKLIYMYDIVGVQKYQKEQRKRVRDWISRRVKYWKPRRKRITRMDKDLYWQKRFGQDSGGLKSRVQDMLKLYGMGA